MYFYWWLYLNLITLNGRDKKKKKSIANVLEAWCTAKCLSDEFFFFLLNPNLMGKNTKFLNVEGMGFKLACDLGLVEFEFTEI